MKNKFMLYSLLVGMLLVTTSIGKAQTINTPYNYPIRPGMAEWKKFHTAEDRYAACQLPTEVLSSLTSEALAITCLNFPLFLEVNMANNIQDGFTTVHNHFNGLQELLNRNDAGKSLMLIYERKNVKDLEGLDEKHKGDFSFDLTYIELVIAQDKIINNLSKEDKDHLSKIAIRQFIDKQRHADIFGTFGLTTTALVLAKLIKAAGQESILSETISPEEFKLFLSTTQYRDENLLKYIFDASRKI